MFFLTNMKKIIALLSFFLLISCEKNLDNRIKAYIDSNCDFDNGKDCVIDLRKVLSIDYDTMYLFDGYEIEESIPIIVNDTIMELNGGLLHGSEEDEAVFVLNREIVYRIRWNHKYAWISEGKKVEKEGIFDGSLVSVCAEMYSSPIFKVTKDSIYYSLESVSN